MDYFDKADIAITICDKEGIIIEMNEQSKKVNLRPGQSTLVAPMYWIATRSRPDRCSKR